MEYRRHQREDGGLFPALPPEWREKRIYDVAELRTSNVDKKSAEEEIAVKLCNYVDVYYHDRITSELDFMEATATEAQVERFSLQKGDVVITKDSESPDDIGVPALIAESIPELVCGYHLTILRAFEASVDGHYLFYALASPLSAYQFYLAANGVTRFGLTYQGTKNIRIAFPPEAEQKQIAAFLDWKTGQIDALIAKKQELIAKLKEKRLAVITQAVTKGLDPKASLRDSSIPWLGKVPEHWEIMKYGYRTHVAEGQVDPEIEPYNEMLLIAPNHIESNTGRVLDLTTAQEQGAISGKYLVRKNDVVYSKIRPHLNKCVLATFNGLCSADMYPIRTEKEMHSGFLVYWMLAQPFLDYATESSMRVAMPKLNRETLSAAPLVVPPLNEQEQIAAFLDSATMKIDAFLEKAEAAVILLIEYRSALITAATTGNIDIRNWQHAKEAA